MQQITVGACPRIGILSKIEIFSKNKHSHIYNIGVFAYLRALFFGNPEEFEQVSLDSERAFSDRLLGKGALYFPNLFVERTYTDASNSNDNGGWVAFEHRQKEMIG